MSNVRKQNAIVLGQRTACRLTSDGVFASRSVRYGMLLLAVLLVGCATERPDSSPTGDSAVAESVVERGPVTIRVRVEPSPARLSDEPTLTITMEAERGVRVEMPPFGDGIGDFLIRDFYEPLAQTQDDLEVSRQVYRLEPTKTGTLLIDPIPIVFHDERDQGDGQVHQVETKPVEVVIESAISGELASLDDLEAMTEPIALDSPGLGRGWWIAIGVALPVVLAATLLLLRRRSAKPPYVPSPQEVAAAELQELRRKDLINQDVKLFYVELTGIVRRYIEGTTPVQAAEQTTEEFLREISAGDQFQHDQRDRLRSFLESADLVKFAAFLPAASDVEEALRRAEDFICPASEPELQSREGPS